MKIKLDLPYKQNYPTPIAQRNFSDVRAQSRAADRQCETQKHTGLQHFKLVLVAITNFQQLRVTK